MAQRRMFSLQVVDTDAFLEMPQGAQMLYFHLAMRADDDGFVSSPKRIARAIGVNEDDFKILLMKRFLLSFESGVVVIKHWRIHNLIRGDRYMETNYKEEKRTLGLNENGAYTDDTSKQVPIPSTKKPDWQVTRAIAKREGSLPDSFDAKIRKHFWGKECPVCQTEMRVFNLEDTPYGQKTNHKPTIQHNKPISKGGRHDIDNISVICHSCNVTIRGNETGLLNNEEVAKAWHTIGNQSAPQVRLGKVRLGKVRLGKQPTSSNDDGFDSFWKIYPRKVGKGAAEKAWEKQNPNLDVVVASVEAQMTSEQWQKDNGQYIPNPATWLNQKRWEDELLSVKQSQYAQYDS